MKLGGLYMYQLVNTMLINKTKNNPATKIVFVRKDKDGNKSFQYVEDVMIKYYYNKPEYMGIGMVNFIEPEKVNGRVCRYDDLYKEVKCLEKEYYEYQNNKQYVQRDSVESEFNRAQDALCRWAVNMYNHASSNIVQR